MGDVLLDGEEVGTQTCSGAGEEHPSPWVGACAKRDGNTATPISHTRGAGDAPEDFEGAPMQ